jgi:hypothetical protein
MDIETSDQMEALVVESGRSGVGNLLEAVVPDGQADPAVVERTCSQSRGKTASRGRAGTDDYGHDSDITPRRLRSR